MKRTLLAVIAAFVTLAAGIEIFQNQHHSIDEAIAMLGEFTRASELADFLTLKAYQRLP